MVRLPVDETVPARISHVSEPPDAAKDVPLEGLRVMIVDDEVDARQLVGQILRMNGAEVREVASSAEALASFESCSPDILISDIGMPGDDGYSLVRRLRERAGGALRALALTGYASSEDREHALSSGFDMHLSKPVKSTELVGAVLSLGRRGQESPLSEIMR
jgi:CheY-like chemotaxis protein